MSKKHSRDTPVRKVKRSEVSGPVISTRGITLGGVSGDKALEAFLRDAGDYIPLYEAAEVRMCVHQYAEFIKQFLQRDRRFGARTVRGRGALADVGGCVLHGVRRRGKLYAAEF